MSSNGALGFLGHRRRKSLLYDVLSISLMTVFIVILSLLNGTWADYPTGYDAEGHLSKIQFVAEFWPRSNWAHIWYDGMPLFKWYGPIPEHLVALLVKATGFPSELDLTSIFLLSIVVTGTMVYLTVLSITSSRSGALLSAFLVVSSSFFWGLGIVGGFYPRIITIAIFSVALYYLFQFAKQSYERNPKRRTLALLVSFLSLSVVSHPVIGAIGFLALFFLCVLSPLKKSRRLGDFAKIFILTALLSVWFMVPAVYTAPASVTETGMPFLKAWRGHFSGDDLVYILTGVPILEAHTPLSSLSPVVIPLLLVLMVAAWRLRRRLNKTPILSVAVISLLLSSSVVVAYAFLVAEYVHLFFLVLSLPIVCGVLFQYAVDVLISNTKRSKLGRSMARNGTAILLFCIIIPSSFVQYPFLAGRPLSPLVRERSSYFAENVVDKLLVNETGTPNYRFGVPSDELAWLNRRYPRVPQTRGYYAQGVLNPDWISWFEVAAWQNASSPEVNFLFDWSAVKWFVVYPLVNQSRFTSKPEFYNMFVSAHPIYGFIYKYATPIMSAGNTSSLLVIGKYVESYTVILHGLSYSDYDSRYIIPITGHEYIDDYDLSELMRFDAIILYGYRYHDRAKAYELLRKYVANGGGLLIETGYSPDGSSSDLPLPSPVESTFGLDRATTWNFSFAPSPVVENIKLSSFSPAKYADGPWLVSTSSNGTIRSWARTVLWSEGYPIVATGEYGKGRVAWSGLNLPFHISSYKNIHESQFLARIIRWISKLEGNASANVEYSVERLNPENMVIRIMNPASEILFKEFYTENWHATLFDAKKSRSELSIYKAGPGFMCVDLPSGLEYPIEVLFDYRTTVLENVSNIVSATTFVAIVMYAMLPPLFDRIHYALRLPIFYLRRKKRAIMNRVRAWWYKE